MDNHRPDILKLLNDYARAWAANQTAEIADHWNPGRFIFYKAEETEAFYHDWQDLLAYWRNNEGLHETISLSFADPHGKPLSDDLEIATVRMRWDIRFAADARLPDGQAFPHRGKAMGGDNHVVVLFCRSDEDWKICGWSETPDAAITYIRSLYFRNFNEPA